MQEGNKKGGKKATKLSLTKRAPKSETYSNKNSDGIRNILKGKVDLNETCEFQLPLKIPGHGGSRVKAGKERKIPAVTVTTKDDELCTEEGDETVHCQVCKKNLSHMTLKCREQHVNRCIDKIEVTEKQEKAERLMLESARTAVLDCPMCGKHFKSENARVVHMKKCSQNVGVTTEKMLQLVKDQEKERQEQVAAGIVPKEIRSKVSKSVVPKKRKIKEPTSQFEEDVQVAMAISSSLASEQNLVDGLSAGDNARDGKRKKSKKTVLEDVCLLTTLTDEDRRKRMEEKISTILHTANNINHTKDTALHESGLRSGSQGETCSLWKMCSRDPVTCDSEQFYVGALVPPLSVNRTEAGKNLRRLSSIPGREKSFVRKNDCIQEKCAAGTSNMSADDIITASTQTAVVLAELAVDDTDIHDSLVSSQLTPNLEHAELVGDVQASGFCVEKMVLNKSDQNALSSEALADYKRMINIKDYSDVSVVSHGQTFFAHKVILAVRCPKLLQMMSESTITLEVPPDIVPCFLNYIYTGDVTLTSSAQSELLKLAKQLELPSLIDACNKAVLHTETSENFAAENIESTDTEFVESQLDMKEIWGESDSDPDQDKDGQSGDKEGQSDSGINDDEYREISCTQKMRIKDRIARDSNNDVESNEKAAISKNVEEINGDASQKMRIKDRIAQDIDNDVESNEKAVISKNVEEINDGVSNSNEIHNVLIDDHKDQTESDTGNSFTSSSPGKVKDSMSSAIHLGTSEKDGNNEVVEIDAEEEPKPKRIRLSSEKELAKASVYVEDDAQKHTSKSVNECLNGESGLNYSSEHESISDEEEIIDTTHDGINSSTADLFGSPTPPKKSAVTVTEAREITDESTCPNYSLQSNSKFSTPLESKTDSKRTLHSGSVPVTPVVSLEIDSDSSSEDIPDKKKKQDKIEIDIQVGGRNDNTSKNSLQNGCATGNRQEMEEMIMIDLETAEENIESAQQAKTTPTFDSSDDDLEITGDNFDDLSQHSPTFNHASSSARSKFHTAPQEVNTTKYLGLKSITEGFSDKAQFKTSEADHKEINSNQNLNDSVSYSKDTDAMKTVDNDFSGVYKVKPFKSKHLTDSASDSDEIITIQTEDSDACDDENVGTEMDRASMEDDDLPSHVKLSDCDEPTCNLKESPVRDVRKTASYGKHEISVYSRDGDNTIMRSPNQSFRENNADVWADFDDCGVTFEPPCRSPEETSPLEADKPLDNSPREASPVIGYEPIEGDYGEASPIIPDQSEVIDLSQNEDDNKCDEQVGRELDGNFLEDGDDSFVFKVDDHPDISDEPSFSTSGVKKTDFKTPTVCETRVKKKGPWVPPSPFTPMPQFGEMATPKLKKEIQKYGVKPVGKKRMIKVLEDIYHQTHQYETDSEVEEEDKVQSEAGPGQVREVPGTSKDNLPASQGDMSSQDSDISDVLEESCLHMSSDSDTSASPQKGIDLTRKLFDFVKSRPEIHSRILIYEPLELDVLKKDIKEAGIRCSMDKLMDFLDERCIAFTSKNSRKRQPGKKGRKKITKPKQTES